MKGAASRRDGAIRTEGRAHLDQAGDPHFMVSDRRAQRPLRE
jgi:hypothetical protein